MYIVIMGGGRMGRSLAFLLVSDGLDVTMIENDQGLCNIASYELDAKIICGNGTNVKVLKEANIKDTDVFIAATGNFSHVPILKDLISALTFKAIHLLIVTCIYSYIWIDVSSFTHRCC
jgi:voltage-gated potassium channel Kch